MPLKNMKLNICSFKNIILMVLVVSIILTGCGGKKQKSPTPEQQSLTGKESDQIPEELTDIEDSIENIIKTLEGPAVTKKEEKKETETQQEGQTGQGSKGQGQGQGGQSQEQTKSQGAQEEGQKQGQQEKTGGEGKSQQQTQPPKPKDPWEEITPVINDLHYKWNQYMPSAVKMGANRNLVDSFSNALNSLTNTVIGKNKTNTLLAASYLYTYVPDFYALYKTGTSPEIKRIRHYTRNAMLNAMTANWTQADTDINNLKSTWSLYKNVISKENQDTANKLDFSVYELESVIKNKNQPLSDIKGRVTLSNVQELEKALEKSSQQPGQEGGKSNKGGQEGSASGKSQGGGASEGGGQ